MRFRKIKATLYVVEDAALLSNRIFFNNSLYGMKNDNFMLLSLRNQLAEYGIVLSTQDIHPPQESALVISLDSCLPFQNAPWLAGSRNYLLLSEPPTYYPHNWNPSNHEVFDRVFTYNTTLTDIKHYSYYYFAIDLEALSKYNFINEYDFQKRKLVVLVAASFSPIKPSKGNKSLLYERYLTLTWFAKNQINDFDLYSRVQYDKLFNQFYGSDLIKKTLPNGLADKIVNIVSYQRKKLFNSVARGSIPHSDKIDFLRKYRFSIAYENTVLPGYLTEKIFDSFAACCVPIYWGEPNVLESIPETCFIDRRDFRSHEQLYKFLKGMGYAEYFRYIEAISTFLAHIEKDKFGSEANASRIAEEILKDFSLKRII